MLNDKANAKYIVIRGAKGRGKTCLINTTLEGVEGVERVTVPPNTSQTDVLGMCQRALAGHDYFNTYDNSGNVKRVLYWYRLFFAGNEQPVIVLTTSERPPGADFAAVTGAVRELTAMGLRLVIDSSPNSLPPDLEETEREMVIDVEDLSREEIRALPQLQVLFATLDTANLSSIVLDLLGGVPAKYELLWAELKDHDGKPAVVAGVVTRFIGKRLVKIAAADESMNKLEPKFDQIFARFKDCQRIPRKELKCIGLELPSRCKILAVEGSFLVPTDPIVALYFKHNCNEEIAMETLQKSVNEAVAHDVCKPENDGASAADGGRNDDLIACKPQNDRTSAADGGRNDDLIACKPENDRTSAADGGRNDDPIACKPENDRASAADGGRNDDLIDKRQVSSDSMR